MSRRKQPKPRHLESEDDIASALEHVPESRPSSNSSNPADDAHVCGKCREEFIGLSEFLAHKKACSRKRLVVLFDAENDESDSQADDSLGSSFNAKVPRLADISDYNGCGSDGEGIDDMDNFDDDENEIMDAEDREIANEEIDEDLIKISMMNAQQDMSDEEEGQEAEEGDSNNNDKTNRDVEKFPDLSKTSLPPHFNPLMFPFLPNSNVVLEPISATRAAVAQFAENNVSPSENNVLHSTLYNLQQQQILQLQLIHQLQQQIVVGMHHPLPGNPLSMLPASLPSSIMSRSFKPDPDDLPMKLTKEKTEDEEKNVKEEPGIESRKPEVDSQSKDTTTPSSSATPTSVPSAFPLPSNSTTPSAPATSEFAKLTKLVERSQYVSDDPFFRHKCRLCHKVFGSDSALQIHIRSHTGERPFKCNICGNRFTTRGNLKVHFERHKAKYPHVKMNPHPVPEHLDKLPPMPMLGSSFPVSAPPPPPLHLQNRMSDTTPPMSISSMMSSIYSGSPFGPRPPQPPFSTSSEEPRRFSSPVSTSSPQTSPATSTSDIQQRKSPTAGEKANLAISPSSLGTQDRDLTSVSKAETPVPAKFHSPLSSSLPHSSTPSPFPILSHLPSSAPPPLLSSSVPMGPSSRDSILPTKMISHDDNLEQYMEIDRSETSKLQQLVDNLEKKVSDPNQCVICHRVLSCKSALQMHYRIHTGERPYKCKICGRAFTTKGNLKTHMGVHRMKPPIRMMHQCPVCHKSFTNLLVLQQHIRSHASLPGMPSMPDFGSLKDMPIRNFPPPMSWPPRPLDFSFCDDNERELDLSKYSSKLGSRNERDDDCESRDDIYDGEKSMDVDDEELKQNQKEEEQKDEELPSGDSGTGSDEGRRSVDENDKFENGKNHERPGSAGSGISQDSGRSASPVSDEDKVRSSSAMDLYTSMAPLTTSSSYTSLAALEERVRAIDSSMSQNRFNPFFLNGVLPPLSNGNTEDRSNEKGRHHYGSESGSDENQSGDEGSKPGTPALSVTSDGGSSVNSGFIMGGDKLNTTCNICYKTFACRSALDIHYRSHTKERPFRCEVCDKSFSTKGNMKQHMLTHKIRDLPNSFSNNSNSSLGQDNSNSNDSQPEEKEPEKPVKPPTESSSRPSVAENGSNNREHVSNGHAQNSGSNNSEPSPFLRRTPLKHQCQVCQKGFSSASALQIHIRTHTGDKPFKCTVCGKAFTTKGNLKVHMGTHMWNNSPSRRGRRMSIEPPFMLAHKDNPYLPGFHHRSPPDFFPFQFPPFMNGVPPHKMNEISVIQSLGGGLGGHMPPMGLGSEHLLSPRAKSSEQEERKSDYMRKADSNGPSGELDLSMKSNSMTSPGNNNSKSSPGSDSWNSAWKTMCHLCNQNFPSPTALELHMQNFHLKGGVNLEAKV